MRNPSNPDWGEGQIQSNINGKITVNFQEVGKVVVNGNQVELEIIF